MKERRFKKKIYSFSVFLLFSFIVYSCLQEDELDSQNKVVLNKNRELTIAAARSWYEANNPPIAATRSVVTHFELMTKPRWNKARESRMGDFEVVEVPLMTKGSAILLDQETKNKYDPEVDRQKIHNVIRIVVIKNLSTGETINFMMIFVGTYDYLMKAKNFHKNSYFHRESDFSGSVYFYQIGGALVNGWRYKDGKIIAKIRQGTIEGLQLPATRGNGCYFDTVLVEYDDCEGFGYEDPEYGAGGGVECRVDHRWEVQEICEDDDSDDEEPWFPPSSNSGGNGGGTGTGSGSGNGGGGYVPPTSGNNPSKPISAREQLAKFYDSASSLTYSQQQKLIKAIEDLGKFNFQVCNLFEDFANNASIALTFLIDPDLRSNAQYSTHYFMRFQSEDAISYISFREEITHAVQHNLFYKEDMDDPNRKNIELEAKIFCEGSQALHDQKFDNRYSDMLIGASTEFRTAVEALMNSIIADGGFTGSASQLELYKLVGNHAENEWASKYPNSTFDPNFPTKVLDKYLKK